MCSSDLEPVAPERRGRGDREGGARPRDHKEARSGKARRSGVEQDFDSWCGFDRTPRWLHRARVTGTYAVETELTFPAPPSDPGDGYHVGLAVEVSPVAGGQLQEKRGKKGTILSVTGRMGEVVGYQVQVGKLVTGASLKDVFVFYEVLEDIQPGTPTSISVREALQHWQIQRTYWHTRMDGVESLCFALATEIGRAHV